MPAKESGKRELEILLNSVELSASEFGSGACKRMVTVELIWPRMQVASKSSVKLLSFAKGLSVPTGWIKRILFKESVEHRFGIAVRVTETVKATAVRKFFRSLAGTMFGIAGDFADDAMPNKYAGDAVSAPFDYIAKELKAAYTAEIVAEGSIDMLPSEITPDMVVEIPLGITKSIYKTIEGHGPHNVSHGKKLVTAEGSVVGKAVIQLNTL